jgi:TRAP transporter TAXI family solute receptor
LDARREDVMRRLVLACVAALLVIMGPISTGSAQSMGIVTGGTKGTYYQFGLNLAELVKSRGVKLNVYDSAGSVENIFAVYKTPGVQMGIVQSDVLAFVAKVQTDPVLKRIANKIRMVFPLYNEEVHVLAHEGIADFDDLADKRVAIGQDGSGTYLTARLLFEVSDVRPKEMLPIGTDEALGQLKQGKIDAMFYVAGVPVKLFSEGVTAEDKLALVPITNKSVVEFYPSVQIPPNTYSWQGQPVNTVAVKAVLVSYDYRGINCEYVAKFARTLYDNLDWLRANGHPKWKSVDLNATVKGWEQYDCVRKSLQTVQRRAPARNKEINPVMDAIKKMFSD